MRNQTLNTYEKRYLIGKNVYKVSIPIDEWTKLSHKKITRWFNSHPDDITRPFPYGTLTYEPHVTPEMVSNHICEKCGKCLHTFQIKSRHMGTCNSTTGTLIQSPETEEDNPRTSTTSIANQNNIQTQNNVYVQNNIDLKDLGKENPKWLTTTLLHQMMDNIYRAIPTMMEKKHFNDEFPENKNLKLASSRDINKRMQVFTNGRWRLRDSKQTFYKVIVDIYDIMSDALAEEVDEDDDVQDEIKEFQRSERFMRKIRRIRPIWKMFQDKMEDHDQSILNEYWEDLKTLLLDRQLGIEQGFD